MPAAGRHRLPFPAVGLGSGKLPTPRPLPGSGVRLPAAFIVGDRLVVLPPARARADQGRRIAYSLLTVGIRGPMLAPGPAYPSPRNPGRPRRGTEMASVPRPRARTALGETVELHRVAGIELAPPATEVPARPASGGRTREGG